MVSLVVLPAFNRKKNLNNLCKILDLYISKCVKKQKYNDILCGHENLGFPFVVFVFHYEIKLIMFGFLECLEIMKFRNSVVWKDESLKSTVNFIILRLRN